MQRNSFSKGISAKENLEVEKLPIQKPKYHYYHE